MGMRTHLIGIFTKKLFAKEQGPNNLALGVARSTTTVEPPSSWVSVIKFSTESAI